MGELSEDEGLRTKDKSQKSKVKRRNELAN